MTDESYKDAFELPEGWTWDDVTAQRALYDIPPHFYPLASAGGAVAWGVPIVPENTPIEIHTNNGGFARGRTWGKTQILQASDGLSICGDVSLRKVGNPDELGLTIPAFRISKIMIKGF